MIFKRVFDFFLAITLLAILSWLILLLIIISSLLFFKNGLFVQKRVGLQGKEFLTFKIRSMSDNMSVETIYGKFIRKYKFDELPQLLNIVIGNMSFVGPRPEVPEFFIKHTNFSKELMSLKPGLTGLASYYFFNEEELIIKGYSEDFLYSRKNKLNLIYFKHRNFCFDFKIICNTFFKALRIK